MRLLILGGTRFLGRHLVQQALARGHTLTMLNRGTTRPGAFPDVEHIRADRDGGMHAIGTRTWDAVIDTSGYVPRVVGQSVRALTDAAGHYTFVSSISVYADFSRPGVNESSPVGLLPESPDEKDMSLYGPHKAACERVVEAGWANRALIIRPGLIVGSDDPTDRFTYWPWRVSQGGAMLAPGDSNQAVQIIDVKDLAAWMLHLGEQRATGTFNATGPNHVLTMGGLFKTCARVCEVELDITWANAQFLREHGIAPWSDMPLYVGEDDPESVGFSAVNISKAIGSGLKFRPLADTVVDTLIWARTFAPDHAWKAGLTRIREAELLAKLVQ